MSQPDRSSDEPHDGTPVAEFHLLGTVDFEECLGLQRRLVYEAERDRSHKVVVLLCEHPDLITVGRQGSRSHIRFTGAELEREQLAVRWVKRGGGAVLHGPGQLALYSIAHLPAHGWSVGEYLSRLQAGICGTLEGLGLHPQTRPGSWGVWARTGLLAAAGVAVQQETTSHGMFLNVHPAMGRFGFVDSAVVAGSGGKSTMSCLLAEHRRAVRMSSVRSTAVPHLASAFNCERYYIHSGHRWLRTGVTSEHVARAS